MATITHSLQLEVASWVADSRRAQAALGKVAAGADAVRRDIKRAQAAFRRFGKTVQANKELIKRAAQVTIVAIAAIGAAAVAMAKEQRAIRHFADEFDRLRIEVLTPISATLTGVAGAVAELLEGMRERGEIREFADALNRALTETVLPAAATAVAVFRDLLSTLGVLSETISGLLVPFRSFREVIAAIFDDGPDAYERMTTAIDDAKAAIAGLQNPLSVLEAEFRANHDQAGDFVDVVVRLNNETRGNIRAAAESKRAQTELRAATEETAATQERSIGVLGRMSVALGAVANRAREVAQASRDAADATAQAWDDGYTKALSIGNTWADGIISIQDSVTEAQLTGIRSVLKGNRDGARKMLLIETALAIARIEAQAALAFGQTLAQLGGATPQAFAQAALAAATVGAGKAPIIASAAVQYESLHSGGLVGRGLAPDETAIVARRGERVLSPQAARALSEPAAQAADAGQRGGERVVVAVKIGHRTTDAMISEALRQPQSSLRGALASVQTQGVGGHNPHG